MATEDAIVPQTVPRQIGDLVDGEVFIPLGDPDRSQALLAAAAEVLLRNASTGEERVVGAAAVPFFTSQGFKPADAAEPTNTAEPTGRHEQPDPADPADPGADTTPTTTSKEN